MRRTRRWFTLVMLLLGVVLVAVPWPPALAERVYLGALLPTFSRLSAPLVDATRVSLTGVLVILLAAAPGLGFGFAGRRGLRAGAQLVGAVLVALLLLFPLTFGLGYRLPEPVTPLAEAGAASAAVRARFEAHLVELLQTSAAAVEAESRVGASLLAPEVVSAASACVADLTRQLRSGYPEARLPTRIKLLPAGLMLRFGFAGVAAPWLLEPHVDAGLAPASALAVSLHELAHSAGFASEATAEAVGMVAGLECADRRVRYAAALRLASNVAAALPSEARAPYVASWPRQALMDSRAAERAQARFATSLLAPGAEAMYDLYLRSQGESAGLGEYDRGTELAWQLYAARNLLDRNGELLPTLP